HNIIAGNTFASLHTSLRNSECTVFTSDMKIQVDKDRHYTYPDISIICGDIEFAGNRDDTVINPLVIFEILSKSTKDYDRGSKFTAYKNIKSLRDYIMIDQYTCHVEYFHKNEAGKWILDEFKNPDDTFKIRSVDIELSLDTIYARVKY
ncbi:MAG: Uma2 family endonuclease, partial [Bacteroidetes bacterium]|nr:Uma2 family endonuclease [Bacteroidota bacterium]